MLFETPLSTAAVKSEATEVVLTAGDGYAATLALAAGDTCGIAIEDGTLSGVFPGQASSSWVKDIRTIGFK